LKDILQFEAASRDIIVETSPDEFKASKRVFARIVQMGYYTYAIDNDYGGGPIVTEPALISLVFTNTITKAT
jgi:hypothetical protein